MDIVYSRTAYRLTDAMHKDHPEARYREGENGENLGLLSKGHDYDMSSNIMSLIPAIFYDDAFRNRFCPLAPRFLGTRLVYIKGQRKSMNSL